MRLICFFFSAKLSALAQLTLLLALYSSDAPAKNQPPKEAPQKNKLIFLGDSLTAGYGLDQKLSFPDLIAKRLNEDGHAHVSVVNAGVSGSTTASGLSRLKWQLKGKPTHLVLALGANDALRGFKTSATKKNLEDILKLAETNSLKVLLAGVRVPPNYGQKYGDEFNTMFQTVATNHHVQFYPYILSGVGGEKHLNQADGIHPNEQGHKTIAENLYPHILKLLGVESKRDINSNKDMNNNKNSAEEK